MTRPRYSLVIPVYNEEQTLPELERRLNLLLDMLDGDAEVILVDDGSADRSPELIAEICARDPRFKSIRLSRNFGHQVAITAGLDLASGDAVAVMDADLQDPPEVLLEMASRWRAGYDVVYAVREHREGDPWLKRVLAAVFYRVLRRLARLDIPADVGDFRLVDRRAVIAFRQLRERNRYIRGLFSWVGFKQVGVPYKRAERHAGETKYPFRKSLRLGIDAIVSFSETPLRIALMSGFAISLLSFVVGIAAVSAKLAGAFVVPGWTSILVLVSFLGGVQLIVLGVTGLYIGRIYDEVKQRPLYLVDELRGFEAGSDGDAVGYGRAGAAVRRAPSDTPR